MNALARFAALAATIAAATAAHAGGPLSICNNAPLKYPGAGTVNLNYDQGNLGTRSKAQADAIITAAVANWTNVTTATITIGRGADLGADITAANIDTVYSNFSDGLNPVAYDTDGTIINLKLGANARNNVLGFAGSAFFGAPTCAYAEGRAVVSGFLSISDTTMRVVMAHEIGHLIGLDHSQIDSEQGLSPSNFPLMYPSAARATDALHEDDIAAVSALYPDATLSTVYGQLTGNLSAMDTTPLRGANIWAKELGTGKVYSIVSDYLIGNNGFFKLLLPAGTYNLFVGAIRTEHVLGSSVGPYSDALTDLSFQPPFYSGANGTGTRMTPVALGGGTPTAFTITAGCAATLNNFRIDGLGTIGGNCGGAVEVFPPNAAFPAGWFSAPASRDLIQNGTFEGGLAAWPLTGNWIIGSGTPHGGTKYMQLSNANGTAGDNLSGTFYQTVTIPAGATSAILTYWISVTTQEVTAVAKDTLRFEVRDAITGALIANGAPHSNLDAGAYKQIGWDLTSFAGQTIRVALTGQTDASLPTLFRVDDMVFNVTAASPWAVANDQAAVGTFSLKSGATPNNGRSDVEYSGNFAAGTVSFARRVSSEATKDFLRFYVDNVLQGEWSGEVAFSTVNFGISAGAHTLRWSYQKDGANAAGSDAAWIDSVTTPAATTMYPLNVSVVGTGSGSVSSSPGGISCGATCSALFNTGASVTLTATPSANSLFTGWAGACTGTGTCIVTMSAAASVSATFTPVPTALLTVTVAGPGTGMVTSIPSGIACPGDCTEAFPTTTTVQLTAAPGANDVFGSWSGDICTGSIPSCNVSMSVARNVTATFVTGGVVSVSVNGPGIVTSTPSGVSCPSDCTEKYASGTMVTLTPTPSNNAIFTGWSGACTGTGACVVPTPVNATASVTANFVVATNVALAANGGVATASSSLGVGAPVSAVNNGDRTGTPYGTGGTWADNTPGAFPDWVQINFAGNRLVNRVVVVTTQDATGSSVEPTDAMTFSSFGLTAFTVETFNGATWTPVATITGNNLVKRTINLTPVTIDRIRISTQGSPDGYSRIAEIEVYGIQPATYGLTVTKAGTGTGTVTSSSPASPSINCGATCAATYDDGTVVTLQATPTGGSSFAGWSGACTGTGSCQVTMNQARAVTATFDPAATMTLTVTRTGNAASVGGVSSNPAGIACGATCSFAFATNTAVTLTASAPAGATFAGWAGEGCAGTGNCQVTMSQARNVTAAFAVVTTAGLDTDGDGISNAVELAEGRNPFVKDNDVFTSARLFAMQQYRDFLGREGDAGGVDFYTNLITSGASMRANVIESFFNSPEFSGTVSPVVRLYFATFLRIPDYDGLQFQVAAYRSGAPLAGIATNFTLSPEFTALYGNKTDPQYVQLLYTNILGRSASQPEIDFHVNRLLGGATRGDILVGFSESPEYQQATANEVYVTMMYVGMLRRAPEQAGFDFWVNYMDSGNPGLALILGFLNSPEYRNRFLP